MAFRSSSQTLRAAGVGTTLTGSAPSGTAAGDYLAAMVVLDGVTADTVTPPSGWTSRGSFGFLSGAPDGAHVEIFDKIATGADSYAWSTSVNNACVLIVGAWSGRNQTNPRTFLTTSTPNTTANATPVSVNLTSGTAATGDDVAYFAMADITVGTDTWGFSPVSTFTEQNDAQTTFAFGTLDTKDNVAAGALGTLTSTATRSAGTGAAGWGGFVISIAAATGGFAPRPPNVLGPGRHPGQRRFNATLRGFGGAATTSPISGAAFVPVTVAGSAAGAGQLSGSTVAETFTAAQIGGALPAFGATVSETFAAGNLGGTAVSQGATVAEVTAAGSLAAAGQVSGAVVAFTFTSGAVTATAALSGASIAGTYAAGVLSDFQSGNLLGALVAGATAAASLAGAAAVSGASVATTYTAGQLTATAALQGSSEAMAIVAGLLTGLLPGAIEGASVVAVYVAGELVSLTPAGPEQTSGHGARNQERLLDVFSRHQPIFDDEPDKRVEVRKSEKVERQVFEATAFSAERINAIPVPVEPVIEAPKPSIPWGAILAWLVIADDD